MFLLGALVLGMLGGALFMFDIAPWFLMDEMVEEEEREQRQAAVSVSQATPAARSLAMWLFVAAGLFLGLEVGGRDGALLGLVVAGLGLGLWLHHRPPKGEDA